MEFERTVAAISTAETGIFTRKNLNIAFNKNKLLMIIRCIQLKSLIQTETV